MMVRLSHKEYTKRQLSEEILSFVMLLALSVGAYVMLGQMTDVKDAVSIAEARGGVIVLSTIALSCWMLWVLSRLSHRKRVRLGGLEGGYISISKEGVILSYPSMYLATRFVYLKSEMRDIVITRHGSDLELKVTAKEGCTGLSKSHTVVVTDISFDDMVSLVHKTGYHPFRRTRVMG